MKFVISGGGTAGHIYPAIAVGNELKSLGHEVVFAGTPDGLEATLAPKEGFEFYPFEISGFNRTKPWTILSASLKAAKSSSKAKKWLRQIRADCVVGFGGYVSIPVGKGAHDDNIPLVIHEQNSFCGMANKYLAPYADVVALTYADAEEQLKSRGNVVITGNPVRGHLLEVDADNCKKQLRIPDEALVLFVFGGSLGARHINTAMVKLAARLLEEYPSLHVIHVTGPKEYDTVKEALSSAGVECSGPAFDIESGWENPGRRYMLTGYFEHMGEALSASDVVVSRAGATSLAEITVIGAVALLVPYPHATDDHQTKNARSLVESGASFMVSDDKVEDDVFAEKLSALLDGDVLRHNMSEKTRALGRRNAASEVANLAVKAAEGLDRA